MSQASSAVRSVFWPGPYSVARGINVVAQAQSLRRLQVVVVSCAHHDLFGPESQEIAGAEVGFRVRFIVAEEVRSENNVPGELSEFCQVDQQREVPVG